MLGYINSDGIIRAVVAIVDNEDAAHYHKNKYCLVEEPDRGFEVSSSCIKYFTKETFDSIDKSKRYEWWPVNLHNLIPDCKILRALYGEGNNG